MQIAFDYGIFVCEDRIRNDPRIGDGAGLL